MIETIFNIGTMLLPFAVIGSAVLAIVMSYGALLNDNQDIN